MRRIFPSVPPYKLSDFTSASQCARIITIIGVICEPNEARAALEMLHCTCAERVLSK